MDWGMGQDDYYLDTMERKKKKKKIDKKKMLHARHDLYFSRPRDSPHSDVTFGGEIEWSCELNVKTEKKI